MGLRRFLNGLFETGRVEVAAVTAPLEAVPGEADALLAWHEENVRTHWPLTPPAWSPAAGRWAAELLYHACQALVVRDLSPQTVERRLAVACPETLSASVIYSADLVLSHVGELLVLARNVAQSDLLVSGLKRIAADWPLSSVGVRDLAANLLNAQAVEIITEDASLLQRYVDRVIAMQDLGRTSHPAVAGGVRVALGMHGSLCPELASLLEIQ